MTAKKRGKKYKIDSRKWPGVYGYDSTKHKVKGKPDTCYYISYKNPVQKIWEKVGWRSEGYTPQIAAEKRAEQLRRVRHGETVKTAREIALEKLMHDRIFEEIKEAYFDSDHGLRLKGRKTDLNRYELHIKSLLAKRRVSTLTPFDIDKVKTRMKDKAPGTIANALELVRRIINYGIHNKLCPPLDFKIELPEVDNNRTEYLEPDQADRFNKVLDEWKRKDIVRMLKLALVTGMRRGEIFNLKNQDIDFHQGLIEIRNPKGGKSQAIPMNQAAREIFKSQIKWRDRVYPDSQYLFPGLSGAKRVDCSAVKRIKEKAKLPKNFRIFHGLRHHFGVTLANSGEFSLDIIGELLTHKSMEMTKRYSQFLPGYKKRSSERAAELVQKHVKI